MPEDDGILYQNTDHIMKQIIGMGIGAIAHALATISACNTPVGKAFFLIGLPALNTIYRFAVVKGNSF